MSRLSWLSSSVSLAVALAASGCGGSASSQHPGGSAAQRAYSASRARGAVSDGPAHQTPLRGTGGNEVNDENRGSSGSGHEPGAGRGSGSGSAEDPCALVTRSEADAILGAAVAPPQEAPLGPTCIYRGPGSADYVTVAVESGDLAKLRSDLRKARRTTIDGHRAYCGDYGRQTTYVSLARRRVLSIAATCSVGERFATKALTRLKN